MRKILFIVVLILLVVTSVQLWMTQDKALPKSTATPAVTTTATAHIGGDFTLTDMNGNIVHDSDFRGRIMLVYFGFSECPELCPMTLSAINKAVAALGSKAGQIATLFITVDPEHDTPAVLKEYLSHFGNYMVGLTGTPEQLKQVKDMYKVYAAKVQTEDKTHATFDHSSYLYIMGKDGKFLTVISADNQQDITASVTPYLDQP